METIVLFFRPAKKNSPAIQREFFVSLDTRQNSSVSFIKGLSHE